jgi:hypothetical protein
MVLIKYLYIPEHHLLLREYFVCEVEIKYLYIMWRNVTGQILLGLIRVQPVKFFSEWPKFEGFKSLTPQTRKWKETPRRRKQCFQKRASSREYGPSVYRFETWGCKTESR